MAGIREYENLKYINENDDHFIDLNDFNYAEFNKRNTNYQYVNSERDIALQLQNQTNVQTIYGSPETEGTVKNYLGASISIVSLIAENLLNHPFVVLRRQCQVHHNSTKYHLFPFTLAPVIIHLHQRQGVTTLWKGLGSCLLVRGMTLAVEDVISKATIWPKDIRAHNLETIWSAYSIEMVILILLTQMLVIFTIAIYSISLAVIMPFYTASLVETVQSDIASEKPGIFDVFREGANRLLSWSAPQKGRMLPVWAMVGPSVSLGLSKYVFGLIVKSLSTRIMYFHITNFQEQKGARVRDLGLQNENIEIYSTLMSLVATEILFYPFETILHRIQLQGTRTIIDNLDSGYSVVPILTSYEGVIDCYRQTITSEGVCGLYKGFGAMLLQFAAHIAVVKLAKWIIIQVTEICTSKSPHKVAEYYNLDGSKTNSASITMSRSLSSFSEAE